MSLFELPPAVCEQEAFSEASCTILRPFSGSSSRGEGGLSIEVASSFKDSPDVLYITIETGY